MISVNDLRTGMSVVENDNILYVLEQMHVKPGKGSAFVKLKFKNLRTGAIYEETYQAGYKMKQARLSKLNMQYLYNDGDTYYFMNLETYEQMEINKDTIGDDVRFLKENQEVNIVMYENEILGINLPDKVVLKVTATEPGVKGNTAQAAQKDATLETGYVVKVPLFIEEGEELVISTQDGKYVSRA